MFLLGVCGMVIGATGTIASSVYGGILFYKIFTNSF